ncbi:protein-L-isoaspartate(D-aspartate) O-methyltransferase [Gayadomonas joobiniege]|uniref:protein-L-isoaspartate(D-aspartate) O-methyltransferase n=1 Tax=Gayadomonas joobiniege TaxID=1234606 RepID=UPI000366A88D|nr:protein-L-isoaspartate(D-aspartate) O-methyltransferase [Gayadomonas joobiniege]
MALSLKAARSGEKLAQQLEQDGISNKQVLAAIAAVPRHAFVQPALAHIAYENTALPIGKGQTISQPAIVAKMSELVLDIDIPVNKLLEIGTGCGYQTAVISQLVERVFSVERIASLQFQARRLLRKLDIHNISLRHGDGWAGWPSKGPFDAILVTAAAVEVPQALLEQLVDGGALVIPIGQTTQILKRIIRRGDEFISEDLSSVRFVPLIQGETE